MTAPQKASAELPVLECKNGRAWDVWLKRHHESPGVWLRFAKKASNIKSVSYDEALEIALCYGWIDGLRKSDGQHYFLQKFTPRRKKSIWSKVNRDKALALIEAGQMKPAGFEEINRAKEDGRWDAAYDSPANAQVPSDFEAALLAN